jgi:hypothetical protein
MVVVAAVGLVVNERQHRAWNIVALQDLFKILQANTRAVKESVLLLLRLATVSVWTTKSAATTAKTQGQLETYCKNVALAIKKVLPGNRTAWRAGVEARCLWLDR